MWHWQKAYVKSMASHFITFFYKPCQPYFHPYFVTNRRNVKFCLFTHHLTTTCSCLVSLNLCHTGCIQPRVNVTVVAGESRLVCSFWPDLLQLLFVLSTIPRCGLAWKRHCLPLFQLCKCRLLSWHAATYLASPSLSLSSVMKESCPTRLFHRCGYCPNHLTTSSRTLVILRIVGHLRKTPNITHYLHSWSVLAFHWRPS